MSVGFAITGEEYYPDVGHFSPTLPQVATGIAFGIAYVALQDLGILFSEWMHKGDIERYHAFEATLCNETRKDKELALVCQVIDLFGIQDWTNLKKSTFEAVYQAAKNEHWDALDPIQNKLPMMKNHMGNTLLAEAILRGDESFTLALIKRGIYQSKSALEKALFSAAKGQLLEVIEHLWPDVCGNAILRLNLCTDGNAVLHFFQNEITPEQSLNLVIDTLLLIDLENAEKVRQLSLPEKDLFGMYAQQYLQSITDPQAALKAVRKLTSPDIALAFLKNWDQYDLAVSLQAIAIKFLNRGEVEKAHFYMHSSYDMLYRMRTERHREFEEPLRVVNADQSGALELNAKAYAIRRSLTPNNETLTQEFANACIRLADHQKQNALMLLTQSVKEQESLNLCVFPCIESSGTKIIANGTFDQFFGNSSSSWAGWASETTGAILCSLVEEPTTLPSILLSVFAGIDLATPLKVGGKWLKRSPLKIKLKPYYNVVVDMCHQYLLGNITVNKPCKK